MNSKLLLPLSLCVLFGCNQRSEIQKETAVATSEIASSVEEDSELLNLDDLSLTDTDVGYLIPKPGTPTLLGRGYNSVTGDYKNDCIQYELSDATASVGGKAPGQTTEAYIQEIKDIQQLTRELSLSSSLNMRFGAFNRISENSSYDYSRNFNSFYHYFLVKIKVANQATAIRDIKLKPEYEELLKSNRSSFLKKCGDQFISTQTTGGEFVGLIEIEINKESERSEIRAQVQGRVSIASGQVDYRQAFNKIKEKFKVNAHLIRKGGSGALPTFDNVDAMLTAALNFPAEVMDNKNPVLSSAFAQSYSLIKTSSRKIPHGMGVQFNHLSLLANKVEIAIERYNIHSYILNNAEKFENYNMNLIDQRMHELEDYIEAADEMYQNCIDLSKVCEAKKIPAPPLAIAIRRRTQFEIKHNMSLFADYTMPSDSECGLVRIRGVWSRYGSIDNTNTEVCSNFRGSYDYKNQLLTLQDFDGDLGNNDGYCTFEFTCLSK